MGINDSYIRNLWQTDWDFVLQADGIIIQINCVIFISIPSMRRMDISLDGTLQKVCFSKQLETQV